MFQQLQVMVFIKWKLLDLFLNPSVSLRYELCSQLSVTITCISFKTNYLFIDVILKFIIKVLIFWEFILKSKLYVKSNARLFPHKFIFSFSFLFFSPKHTSKRKQKIWSGIFFSDFHWVLPLGSGFQEKIITWFSYHLWKKILILYEIISFSAGTWQNNDTSCFYCALRYSLECEDML